MSNHLSTNITITKGRRNILKNTIAGGIGLTLLGNNLPALPHTNNMSKETFNKYISHFNLKEYAGFAQYYLPDVTATYPGGKQVQGPENIVANYLNLHASVNEHLEIDDLMIDGDRIFCSMYTVFSAFRDFPNFKYGEFDGLKAGQVAKMTNFVVYVLKGDKFKSIRIAHHTMHNSPDSQ